MRSISKEILIDLLELILEKATLVINRNQSITCAQDFLTSPDRMEKFDAACMLIQVVGETAKTLSERFGKILQKRESMSINRNDTSTSFSTQLDSLIPASKISTLSQGMFVGAVTDNFGETIDQKIFHAQIVVDNDAVQKETATYQPIPEISSFLDENGNDIMEQQIQANYRQIKQDIVELVENELIHIENDPALKHLLGDDEGAQAQA